MLTIETCTGCGSNGATGTCSGTDYTCTAATHTNCQTVGCGGSTKYCTYVAGSGWQWSSSCDNTAPTGGVTGVPTSWQNTDASITVTCSDTGSGCDTAQDYYYLDNDGTCPAFSAATYTAYAGAVTVNSHKWFCYSIADLAGNRFTTTSGTDIKVDKTAPVASVSGAPADWVNTDQTATVSCSDTGGSACSSAAYRYKAYASNPGSCSTTLSDYTSGASATITASFWVCSYVQDAAGNSDFSDSAVQFKVDKVLPTVAVSHAPADIKSDTPVTITATATDSVSGLQGIEIYLDRAAAPAATCTTSPCTYTTTGTHTYRAVARDRAGNAQEGSGSFTVCALESVSIAPNCGSDSRCSTGETVSMSAGYSGACPATSYLQIDARDDNSLCRIEGTGGQMSGMQAICRSSPCTGTWTIPTVPLACKGMTVNARAAGVWKNGFPGEPGVEQFATSPASGQFVFIINPSTIVVTPSLTFSSSNPNLGDVTEAYVTATVTDAATGETIQCTSGNCRITSIKVEGNECKRGHAGSQCTGDRVLEETWEVDASNWEIDVDTSYHHSTVEVTVEHIPSGITGVTTNSFTVNLPPVIERAQTDPSRGAISRPIILSADIIDPEGDVITFRACKDALLSSCTEMCRSSTRNGEKTYSCSYVVQLADTGDWFVEAVDSKGASSRLQGPRFNVVDRFIEITLTYDEVQARLVPIAYGNVPSYTRGMNINFDVKGRIVRHDGVALDNCRSTNCDAFYRIRSSGDWLPLNWDTFASSFIGNRATAGFACDSTQLLDIRFAQKPFTPASAESVEPFSVVINCQPKVLVNPLEKRVKIGERGFAAFEVTLVNPDEQKTYVLSMQPVKTDDSYLLSWFKFDCTSLTGGTTCHRNEDGTLNDNLIENFVVPQAGTRSVNVLLTNQGASRAGVYKIKFVAQASPAIEGTGTLQVFSEGLDEFPLVYYFVLLLSSLAVFAWMKR